MVRTTYKIRKTFLNFHSVFYGYFRKPYRNSYENLCAIFFNPCRISNIPARIDPQINYGKFQLIHFIRIEIRFQLNFLINQRSHLNYQLLCIRIIKYFTTKCNPIIYHILFIIIPNVISMSSRMIFWFVMVK